jgi:signal transduction histidine kinase
LRRGEIRTSVRRIALDEVLANVVDRCAGRKPAPALEPFSGSFKVMADPDRLGMLFEHLVRNAQDATPADGVVTVRCVRDGADAVVQIVDNGAGMSPEFIRDRLFKPFDSTKGAKGMGIGAYQAREYVRSMGGQIEVSSTLGVGSVFSVRLTLADSRDQG